MTFVDLPGHLLPPTEVPTPSADAAPKVGQQTRRQTPIVWTTLGADPYAGCTLPPGSDPTAAGMYATYPWWFNCLGASAWVYRLMLAHPTIALARAIVLAPVISNTWEIEQDEDADEKIVDWVRDNALPHRPAIVNAGVRMLDFGNQPLEVVWQRSGGLYTFGAFKPLSHELTQLLQDDKGNFAGLRNQGVDLVPQECLWFVNDESPEYPLGRSRLENHRQTAWMMWLDAARKSATLDQRVSDIIPVIVVPSGDFEDPDKPGERIGYAKAAASALTGLAKGNGVILESLGFSAEDIQLNPSKAGQSLTSVDTLDFGNRGPSQAALLAKMEYADKLMFRGMLRGERTGLEASSGTRADAEAHTDTGVNDAENIDDAIADAFNRGPLATALRLNFGPAALRGEGAAAMPKVRIKPSPLVDRKMEVYRQVLDGLLANADTAPQLAETIDVDKVLKQMDLPAAGKFIAAMQAAQNRQAMQAKLAGQEKQQQIGGDKGQSSGRVVAALSRYIDDADGGGLMLAADAGEGEWRTIHGVHVLIGGDGKIARGPAKLVGRPHAEITPEEAADAATVHLSKQLGLFAQGEIGRLTGAQGSLFGDTSKPATPVPAESAEDARIRKQYDPKATGEMFGGEGK